MKPIKLNLGNTLDKEIKQDVFCAVLWPTGLLNFVMEDVDQLTDKELLSLIGTGDVMAFNIIFKKYNRELYAAAYNKLRDREEAKDVVQDVFSRLWCKAGEINLTKADLPSYLHIAVRNRIFDLISKKKSASAYLEDLRTYLLESAEHADYLIREKQMKAMIEEEIATLPPRMREVFVLSRNHHLSHKEIAHQLNVSDQTVTDQVKKALKILKTKVSLLPILFFFFFY